MSRLSYPVGRTVWSVENEGGLDKKGGAEQEEIHQGSACSESDWSLGTNSKSSKTPRQQFTYPV
ncbi:hypothetical protein ASPCADRAFT_206736 [Aspergillus carbonarius ITEM 5010]|uniref:Uncharacterized protein n=1 Tax=Aspergillus carbonarius (strain ITEM 5010) TaxID=602072 RepID=A0A1R3RPZ8_ASPC5|nr:hypothetical protein ASPCADRAFT_206736 [Aspergillus carbonarius ITEM 5010]